MDLESRVRQYKKNGKNLFSTTEAITAALLSEELYQALMPEQYKNNPMEGYFRLDADQRVLVDAVHQADRKFNNV